MSILQLILQILIIALGCFFGVYIKKKAENVATKEDVEEITRKVEAIKLAHQKALSEYDVRLENFRKVVTIRIDAAEQLAGIRKAIWDLFAFRQGRMTDIESRLRDFTSYMNAYVPFFRDCSGELASYSQEMKKLEGGRTVSNEDLQPVFKAMEALLEKILDYR